MDKHVSLGLAAGLLITVGFLLGWFVRGRPISPLVPPAVKQRSDQSSASVVVSIAGVPVLLYEGPTLDTALAAGNKQPPSKALADCLKPDPRNPLFGTVSAGIDIQETYRSGAVSSSPHYSLQPVELVLVRREPNATDWALTAEAIAAIHQVKNQ